jgi:hypothetical protein
MKSLLITISFFISVSSFAFDSGKLALGYDHTCFLNDEGVECWGQDWHGLTSVPKLRNPKQISAGGHHTCALDDGGVKCWGWKDEDHESVPSLRNPRHISSGPSQVCALDDDGVKCWGSRVWGARTWSRKKAPRLNNPVTVALGGDHVCVIDAKGVKCWGDNKHRQTNVPRLNNPKSISTGWAHNCALDDDGVKCWGLNNFGQINVPRLKNSRSISAGGNHTCALDESGVKCWGSNEHGQTTVPRLKNPILISTGANHSCALDDNGVKCWGSNIFDQTRVPDKLSGPRFEAPSFLLKDVSTFLEVIAEGSSPVKARILTELGQFADKDLTEVHFPSILDKTGLAAARYTLVALMNSVITSGDSEYYLDMVIPAYKESIHGIKEEIGVRDLNDVFDLKIVREVALKVIQVSLTIVSEFLSLTERKELQETNRLLGAAIADAGSRDKVKSALDSLRDKEPLLSKVQQAHKISFLYDTLYTATEFLERKVL